MDKLLAILLALLAITSAVPVEEPLNSLELQSYFDNDIDNKEGIATRGLILNSKGKKMVNRFIEHLKTGWPDDGVPPLAPYTKDEIVFELKKSFLEIFAKIENFRIDGLDNVVYKKVSIHYTFNQRVKFNFLFPKIVIGGKFLTQSFLDIMKAYGIKIEVDTKADFELVLENITFQGYFKYTMPFIFGSIEIYKFDGSITLGNVVSKIDALMGLGRLNQLLNETIEEVLMKLVSSNQDMISKKLEETLVPFANSKLKGSKIWSVIG